MQQKSFIKIVNTVELNSSPFSSTNFMKHTLNDVIEKEVVINGSKERVFQAISDPSQIISWFPESVEGKFEVNEKSIFDFGKHGRVQVVIVANQPSDYFAYRLNRDVLQGAKKYLEMLGRQWEERLGALKNFVESEQ